MPRLQKALVASLLGVLSPDVTLVEEWATPWLTVSHPPDAAHPRYCLGLEGEQHE